MCNVNASNIYLFSFPSMSLHFIVYQSIFLIFSLHPSAFPGTHTLRELHPSRHHQLLKRSNWQRFFRKMDDTKLASSQRHEIRDLDRFIRAITSVWWKIRLGKTIGSARVMDRGPDASLKEDKTRFLSCSSWCDVWPRSCGQRQQDRNRSERDGKIPLVAPQDFSISKGLSLSLSLSDFRRMWNNFQDTAKLQEKHNNSNTSQTPNLGLDLSFPMKSQSEYP